ncbi:amino acid ABC transporter substrate-binding protein [Spirochaetia bacterium]|nr:amino acid ABC transporter substrate-binding protein [Spirochaetia bacterium]
MKKLTLLVLAFAVAVSAFAGGKKESGDSLAQIKANGKIRIGVFTDKAPFGFVDAQGVYQGYDVYFAHRIAKDLLGDENAITFVPVEPASRVEFLESDKVDIILANFTVTPARAEAVDFALPYMKVALGIVSPDSAPITDISQLEGKELIIIKGTTAETYFAENHPKIIQQKYDQISAAFNALKDGRGAALSQDNTLLFAWAIENPGFTATIGSIGSLDTIAPAVRKGNKVLLDWLNNEIKATVEDDFFHKDYQATLAPVYGTTVDPESVVVERGIVK